MKQFKIKDNFLKNLKIRKREITLILVTVMVISLFSSGYSLGKEMTNTNIYTKAEFAKPILIVENAPIIQMTGKKEREVCDFMIKNYNENNEITQVNLIYDIEIMTKENKAISYHLYQDGKEIEMDNQKTKKIQLSKEGKQEHLYTLEVLVDKEKAISMEEIKQDIQIKVHSEQLK